MIKKLILVIVTVMTLTGCQFELMKSKDFTQRGKTNIKDISIEKTFIEENKVLVGIGDSLTQGVGDDKNQGGYIGRIASEVSNFRGVKTVEIENLSKRGRRSDQLLDQLVSGKINQEKSDF